METNLHFKNTGLAGLMAGSVLLLGATFTACNREAPPLAAVVASPPPAPASPQVVVVQDDYVYYPQYEIYYSSNRHQYAYQHGGAWTWQPEPPQVALNVLVASPSVRMEFHDSPSLHHETVVRSYPRGWSSPGRGREGRGPGGR